MAPTSAPPTPTSPFPSPGTVQPSSLSRLTLSDKLLLSQAVHHIGSSPPDWGRVSSILLSHPLIKTKSRLEQASKAGITLGRVFGSRECERAWVALMRQYNLVLQPGERDAAVESDGESSGSPALANRAKEARGLPPRIDRGSQLALAQFLYAERIREIQDAIKAKESAFKAIVAEIDALNSGSLDDKLFAELEKNAALREEAENEAVLGTDLQSSGDSTAQRPGRVSRAASSSSITGLPLAKVGGISAESQQLPSAPDAGIVGEHGESSKPESESANGNAQNDKDPESQADILASKATTATIEKAVSKAEDAEQLAAKPITRRLSSEDRDEDEASADERAEKDEVEPDSVAADASDEESTEKERESGKSSKRKRESDGDKVAEEESKAEKKRSRGATHRDANEIEVGDKPGIPSEDTDEKVSAPKLRGQKQEEDAQEDEDEGEGADEVQEGVEGEAPKRPEPRRSRRSGRTISGAGSEDVSETITSPVLAKNNRVEALRSREASGTPQDTDEEGQGVNGGGDGDISRSTIEGSSRSSHSPGVRRGRSVKQGRRGPRTTSSSAGGAEDESMVGAEAEREREKAAQVTRQRKMEKVLMMLLNEVSNHTHGNLFHAPIKRQDAPDYYALVRHPLDLKTIKARIKEGRITTAMQLRRALAQMFANSLIYNRPDSDIHRMALEMRTATDEILDRFEQTQLSASYSRSR